MRRTVAITPIDILTLADGRSLAHQRYGNSQGRPLYVFHGFPGCRLQARLQQGLALAAGVCLVAVDRPGFGGSSPAPDRTLLDWADDVAQLADALGHERFGVVGVSCGGPHALACALRLPHRVRYTGLLAGIGPMDDPALRRGQLPALRMLFALARVHPALVWPFLRLDRWMFLRDPEKAVRTLSKAFSAPDRAMLATDPTLARNFAESVTEAYRQGVGGAMTEAALIARPRGFRLEDITVPVHLYQGGLDRLVPVQMARHMAAHLPQARLQLYPGEGHLSAILKASADCLADFLAASWSRVCLGAVHGGVRAADASERERVPAVL